MSQPPQELESVRGHISIVLRLSGAFIFFFLIQDDGLSDVRLSHIWRRLSPFWSLFSRAGVVYVAGMSDSCAFTPMPRRRIALI
jgi:hypothetical protein